MNYEVVTIGSAKKMATGVAVGIAEGGVWMVDDTARVVVEGGIRAWVKRGGGQSGWLSDGKAGVFVTTPVEGDVYLLGDDEFWQRTPEEMLADFSGSFGNGAIIRFLRPAPAVTKDSVSATPKLPFATRLRGMQTLLQERLPHRKEQPMFVVHGAEGDQNPASRKRLMVTGIATIVVLGFIAGAGHFRKATIERATNSQNAQIELIVAQFREAKAVVDMNPERGKQLLSQAQTGMDSLTGEYAQDERLNEVKQGMGAVLGAAAGTRPLMSEQLIDLGLLREGMKGERLVFGDDAVWVLDTSGGRVVKVNAKTGAGDVSFAQTTFGSAHLLASYPGKIYVLGEKGISECVTSTLACKIVVEKDTEWGDISDMGVWAGNIYLLDSGKQTIWKYAVIETGFGARQSWLASDTTMQLEHGKGLAIDGSLWTMAGNDGLQKITRGVGEHVTLSGFDAPLGGSVDIYTTDDLESVYLLDSEHGRLVQVTKSGVYVAQWTDEHLKSATDFVVDQKSQKVIWVSGQVVWQGTISS